MAKDNEIAIYRQQSIDMIKITKTLANRPINVEAKAMSNSHDSSKSINAVGDVNISNSVVNLADTIGEVNYAIQEIPDSSNHKNSQLKKLLQELTEAITDEAELDDEEKADAVNKVKAIVQASKKPDDQG